VEEKPPKWPLTPGQIVLGAWALGLRDPSQVYELARRYADAPGPSLHTPEEVLDLAVDMEKQGVRLETLASPDQRMARWAAEKLRPFLDGAEDD